MSLLQITAIENNQLSDRKTERISNYVIYTQLDNGLKGTVENWACQSVNGGSLEIMSLVSAV